MNPIIVALDVPTPGQMEYLCQQLDGRVGMFKVGLEAVYAMGSAILPTVAGHGDIFFDCKLHDIPNTVAEASRQIAVYPGVTMFNVHALGGRTMMKAAVEAASEVAEEAGRARPTVIAVTLLTSMEESDMRAMGLDITKDELVGRLAETAGEAGCDGVVAAAEDVGLIRARMGPDFLIVTPGIRPVGAEVGDQKRIATPGAALRAGSDYLVIGRPITRAENPAAAADAILAEIDFSAGRPTEQDPG